MSTASKTAGVEAERQSDLIIPKISAKTIIRRFSRCG